MDRLIALGIAVAATAAAPAQTPSPLPSERPSLSGHWRFNPDQSEDANQKLRDAMAARQPGSAGGGGYSGHRGGGGMGGFGGGYGGGHRGGGGTGGSERQPADSQETMRSLLEATPAMSITHTDSEIAVLEKDGRLRTFHPDGQKYKTDTGAEVKTHWDKDHLIVETKLDRGPNMTETLGLTSDRKQLWISVRLDGRSSTVTVKRVYDAEAPQ